MTYNRTRPNSTLPFGIYQMCFGKFPQTFHILQLTRVTAQLKSIKIPNHTLRRHPPFAVGVPMMAGRIKIIAQTSVFVETFGIRHTEREGFPFFRRKQPPTEESILHQKTASCARFERQ
jgi:hypothetical protein